MNERRKGYLKGYNKGRKFDLTIGQYILLGMAFGVVLSLLVLVVAVNI